MRENFASVEVTLSPAELDAVKALDSDGRIGSDPAKAAFSQM